MSRARSRRLVCVVWDGLRPDLVSPETTPTLWGLAERGVWHERARSVFPSETRVATSSFATGSYPARHGIAGNSIVVRSVAADRALSTGQADTLLKLAAAEGRMLATTTLGEALRDAGGVMAAASAGSAGNATLINPGAVDAGTGYVVNWAVTWPESAAAEVRARFGQPPGKTIPVTGTNDWTTRVFCEWLLPEVVARHEPAVGVLWLSDPDATLHARGFGTPELVQALRECDARLGRVVEAMRAAGLAIDNLDAGADLIVLSDHGHTTAVATEQRLVQDVLAEGWADELARGELVFAGKSVYVEPALRPRLPALARQILAHPSVGHLFAANPTDMPGVLPMAAVNHGGSRAPDLIFSPQWEERAHASGVPGHSHWPGSMSDITGHGSLCPFDMRTTLVAVGPSFKSGVRSAAPVGIVDVAPTALHLLGIPIPPEWDGRPLVEALRDGADPDAVDAQEGSIGGTVTLGGSVIEQRVNLVRVGHTLYVDSGASTRTPVDA